MDADVDGITLSVADGVATLTLDRPDKHNALTLAMRQYLEQLPAVLDDRSDVRCLVVDARGPSFCAGADLAEIEAADGGLPESEPAAGLRAVGVPVVAAVHATCVTGGLELALAADMIVAGRSARFADTHTRMGVLPRWGMAAALPRRLGTGRALELSLTGRWVDAAEAFDMGLVDALVDDDELADRVAAISSAVAAADPEVVADLVTLMSGAPDGSLDEALAAEETAWRARADRS